MDFNLASIVRTTRGGILLPLLLAAAMLEAAALPHMTATEAASSAITAELKSHGVKAPEVIAYVDLTEAFGSRSNWALAVVRENVPRDPEWDEHGPLFICFLKDGSPPCLASSGSPVQIDEKADRIPFDLLDARIVQMGTDGQSPRLLVKTCTEPSGDGDCGIYTILYAYNKTADRFDQVFSNHTARNNNQRTWFIESGPLRGDIVVDYPTTDAPYAYWLEVHQQQAGQYSQILRYRGKTAYGDSNRLAVVDSEMPEILRRLGLWKAGDPLPVPAVLPAGCTSVYMRGSVEWCK